MQDYAKGESWPWSISVFASDRDHSITHLELSNLEILDLKDDSKPPLNPYDLPFLSFPIFANSRKFLAVLSGGCKIDLLFIPCFYQ
jgi:hypothetical protein